ncbi:MAG: stage II sporulation protein E, partial [Planctomycetaceae bacterium]|nr:stage II sporulation protein E [Planctomycetaceae bacterium]
MMRFLTDMAEGDWEQRLDEVYAMMEEMSRQTDPQAMVRNYGQRISRLMPSSRRISLSRRGLSYPYFRVTRYSEWIDEINPWKQKDRLPLLQGGLFAELLYSNQPAIIDELQLNPDDPAAPYLAGQGSLMALP